MNTKILLAFPPHCETSLQGPHLAIPFLSAYLRQAGFTVRTKDLNLGFFRYMLGVQNVTKQISELKQYRTNLEAKALLSESELDTLLELSQAESLHSRLMVYGENDLLTDEDFLLAKRLLSRKLYDETKTLDEVIQSIEEEKRSVVGSYFDRLNLTALSESIDLIGISVAFHLQLHPALELAARLRRIVGTSIPIVVGGSQISLMTEEQKRKLALLPYIDGVIVYEGEVPLTTLASQIDAGQKLDFSVIPNTYYSIGEEVYKSQWHHPPAMATLPCPEFNSKELKDYLFPRTLPVYVSKGCYWGRCKFCDYTKLYTPGQVKSASWATFRPVELLVDDIEKLANRHGTNSFYLVSEAIPKGYYTHLAKEIIKRRLNVRLSSYCRVEKTFTADFFRLLRKAGVRTLTFGAEATEDRILKLIDKGNTVSDICRTIRYAHAAGIQVVFNLIPDYPTVTWKEVQKTISFIRNNIDYIDVVNAQFFDLSSNSVILNEQEEHGISILDNSPIKTNHGVHSVAFKREHGLSQEQILQTRGAFRRLSGEVRSHRKIRDLVFLITSPQFNWQQASFVLESNLEVSIIPFDPSTIDQNGDVFQHQRLDSLVLVIANPNLRRRLTCPPEVKAILETAELFGPFTIENVMEYMSKEWHILNRENCRKLLQNCLDAMLRAGMISEIFHPWFNIDLAQHFRVQCELTNPLELASQSTFNHSNDGVVHPRGTLP